MVLTTYNMEVKREVTIVPVVKVDLLLRHCPIVREFDMKVSLGSGPA